METPTFFKAVYMGRKKNRRHRGRNLRRAGEAMGDERLYIGFVRRVPSWRKYYGKVTWRPITQPTGFSLVMDKMTPYLNDETWSTLVLPVKDAEPYLLEKK